MIRSRAYRGSTDEQKINKFLRDVYMINEDQRCWSVQRFQYERYFSKPFLEHISGENRAGTIRLWEDGNGNIMGMVNKEDDSSTFIQVHPGHEYLQKEMIKWIEDNCDVYAFDHGEENRITIWCSEKRRELEAQLLSSGYIKDDNSEFEHQMWKELQEDIPEAVLPEGYSFSSLEGGIDINKRIDTYREAFGLEIVPMEVYRYMQKSPLYKKEMDLIVITEDGNVASFCTVWIDSISGTGVFEPVGTHPKHQRKGLCRALMNHGLNLMKELGCSRAYLSAYGEEEVQFYNSVGFMDYHRAYPWIKTVDKKR